MWSLWIQRIIQFYVCMRRWRLETFEWEKNRRKRALRSREIFIEFLFESPSL